MWPQLPRALPALTAALLLISLAAACGSARRMVPVDSEEAQKSAEPPILFVQNNHWADVTIWALTGGQRNRLGTVTAARSAEFVFPNVTLNRGGELRLIARALADNRPLVSETIVVRPGMLVEWTLESSLSRSSLRTFY